MIITHGDLDGLASALVAMETEGVSCRKTDESQTESRKEKNDEI